jgi:hypothetical protein
MKYLALFVLVSSITTLCIAQTPSGSPAKSQCSLTLEQSPEIRGVRLGMSAEKLMAAFPADAHRMAIENALKEAKKADNYGFARANLFAGNSEANPRLSGVGVITVEFLDERITTLHVSYSGPEWKNTDQFIAKLSEAFRLPTVDHWRYEPGANMKSLTCDGFLIQVYTGRTSDVMVKASSALQVVNDRREAVKEKERQAFKP